MLLVTDMMWSLVSSGGVMIETRLRIYFWPFLLIAMPVMLLYWVVIGS